ncbi:MAG TPA: GYD domain-containing protein [Xanthobacteraceae bacterium]|nr:GYD domain-containing protein [Xanthobacteraceae bacterium]
MATYIVLCHFTDQGVRDVKDSPKRAAAFKAEAKKAGVTVKAFYWTLGRYDMISILEGPDAETVTALGLSVGKLGNVRTETLPAFDHAAMDAILKKVA